MGESNGSARSVVILGSGVIGLSIAHVLCESPPFPLNITIVARDMPEDMDSQAWASPWAGANWSPIGGFDEKTSRWELETFNKLWDMIPTGRAMSLPSRVFYSNPKAIDGVWYQHLVRNFKEIPKEEVPSKFNAGFSYETLSVNPTIYLPWLKSELEAKGVKFIRKALQSLEQATEYTGSDGLIINATSIGSRSLVGVRDTAMYPARGQTIFVYAPSIKGFHCTEVGDPASHKPEATYIIPRPGPEDIIVCGGSYQPGNWDLSVDAAIAEGIFERCAELEPALKEDPRVRIVAHNVGLRPCREGGPRVEAELVQFPIEGPLVPKPVTRAEPTKVLVVHAYGFGGAGYQMSWGVATEVKNIIKSSVQ